MSTLGQNILCIATEGGTGYWGRVVDAKRTPDLDWIEVTMEDCTGEEEFDTVTVKATQMEAAARALITPEYNLRSDLKDAIKSALRERDAGYIDADAADCIVQHAAFGEVVFG